MESIQRQTLHTNGQKTSDTIHEHDCASALHTHTHKYQWKALNKFHIISFSPKINAHNHTQLRRLECRRSANNMRSRRRHNESLYFLQSYNFRISITNNTHKQDAAERCMAIFFVAWAHVYVFQWVKRAVQLHHVENKTSLEMCSDQIGHFCLQIFFFPVPFRQIRNRSESVNFFRFVQRIFLPFEFFKLVYRYVFCVVCLNEMMDQTDCLKTWSVPGRIFACS